MRTPKQIFILGLAVFLLAGLAALASSRMAGQSASLLDHEEQALRQELTFATTSKEVDRIWSGLDRIDKDRQALGRWEAMSPVERQGIVDKMKDEARQAMSASVSAEDAKAQSPSEPFLGIFDGEKVPAPFRGAEFRVVNYWGGELDGQPASAYAGYRPNNPEEGVLAVAIGEGNYHYDFFAVPLSSGPLRITDVVDGEIRLVSVGGTFTKESTGGEKASVPVDLPGGEEFTFDLRSRHFR